MATRSTRPRQRRSDCFFGIHLAVEAQSSSREPAGLSEEVVRRLVASTRCDYVQAASRPELLALCRGATSAGGALLSANLARGQAVPDAVDAVCVVDEPAGHAGDAEATTRQREAALAELHRVVVAARQRGSVEVCGLNVYGSRCPEPVRVPTDFAAGEFRGWPDAALEARVLSNVGMPWEMVSPGAIAVRRALLPKPVTQMKQEAAAVLAMGGGFGVTLKPDSHGEPAEHDLSRLAELAEFCFERRDTCWKSEPIGQVAILLDTGSAMTQSDAPLRGMLQGALDAGHACDVLADHQFNWQQDRYPVVVVPQWSALPVAIVHELVEYARRGGSLLLVGSATARQFVEYLGVRLVGESADEPAYLQTDEREPAWVGGWWQAVEPAGEATRVLGWRTPGCSEWLGRQVAATVTPLGAGKIAAIYGPIGQVQAELPSPVLRDWIGRLLDQLYRPIVKLDSTHAGRLHVVLRSKGARTMVHLLDVAGTRGPATELVDRLPPTGPVTLRVHLAGKPRKVTQEPLGRAVKAKWLARSKTLVVRLGGVEVHGVVAVR